MLQIEGWFAFYVNMCSKRLLWVAQTPTKNPPAMWEALGSIPGEDLPEEEMANTLQCSTYFTVISKTAVIPWVHWSYLLAEGV